MLQSAQGTSITGSEPEFSALVERHRRELHVHCYRMLGSFQDAEDVVQDTFLRAWRGRATFAGRSTLRAWLYRIATNACLDALERLRRPAPAAGEFEVSWLQPYPDALLDELASDEAEPAVAAVERETIELAFMVAIQQLPPRTRAVLILRDVLGWPAKDTAALLEMSVAAVNSALQRARGALKQHLPERRLEWEAGVDAGAAERELLRRYMQAGEQGDAQALAATLHDEATFAMPPEPEVYAGRRTLIDGWVSGGFGKADWGDMRCVLTGANRQPAVACYLRRPGAQEYLPLAIDVLRFETGTVAAIVTFGPDLFPLFDLPPRL